MITRVHRRGSRVGGLLRYLWGLGKAEEHVNPRLVAAWDGAGPLSDLEPKVTASGKRDLRALTALLEQPVRAGDRPPNKFVWHASMRLAPEDRHRTISDSTWASMAVQMLTEVGVATTATDPGLRWIAMRHADEHVHIVATLVREDGRTNWMRNDYPRCVKATYNVARRYNLQRWVPPADRTAHRRPHPVEVSKARRVGRAQTPRDELRRRVRTVVAAAGSEEEFFARLREAGVLVRLRPSSTDARQITGYAVALPGARTAGGQPVYFGGGRLAPDMSLPKLRLRWGAPTLPPTAAPTVSRSRRVEVMRQAAKVAAAAAANIRRAARTEPARAQATAVAAADLLTSLAYAMEGHRRGPLHRAAEVFDRAARDLYGRIRRSTSRSQEMRAMSRLVALTGRNSGDDAAVAALALVLDLARLADTLEQLRRAQQRLHQAEAARAAADALRVVAGGRQPAVTLPLTPTPNPTRQWEAASVLGAAAEQAKEVHVAHPQQHEDPMAETRQQFLQGLATMATVGEAGARWAAVGIQNKAAERERQAQGDQAASAARREADRLAAKVSGDRKRMAASLDGDWLVDKATFAEAAATWRTATVHASSDPLARRTAEFAEQRLRQFRPDLMAAYERHRQAGTPIPEAMRAAAREVWERDARAGHRHHGARAHGGTPDRAGISQDGPAALPPGGRALVDDFDAAVRQEVIKLAEHVRPEALDELQRQWRATGKLPAGEPVQLLRDLAAEMNQAIRAGEANGRPVEGIRLAQSHVEEALDRDLQGRSAAERGEGVREGGALDDPRTVADEYAVAQPASVVHDDGADYTDATAAAVHHADQLATPAWVQAFPKLRVAQVDAALAAKQAAAATAVPMRGRSR